MKFKIITLLSIVILLASCSTNRENISLPYFQTLKERSGTLPDAQNYDMRIQPDDELIISVTSAIPEATVIYNTPLSNPATRKIEGLTPTATPQQQTYIVDSRGNIDFPVLGTLHVAGKTVQEITDMIKNAVGENVKDPYVHVQSAGFSINMMGEVKAPQQLHIKKEKFSLLDALAAAGDLTEYGRRDKVLVIRTVNGKSTYQYLNLTDSNIFSSPYFYMQQNDVVYVEPNSIKADNSKYNQYSAFKLSQLSAIVSVASVITSLAIALLVK